MNSRNVIWTPVVREKLIEFRNESLIPLQKPQKYCKTAG